MKEYAFEKLNAWKESRILVKLVYHLSAYFPEKEKFGLQSQIRRAVISVSSNLSEGSGRLSKLDQKRFYQMAYSSLMEILNQLILAHDLEFINSNSYFASRKQVDTVAKLISGLAKP